MIRFAKMSLAATVAFAAASGCTGDGRDTQQVTGKLALSSFPAPVTGVRVRSSDGPEAAVPVGVDGAFTLSLEAGHGYRIDFMAGDRAARLVYPRKAGRLDMTFDVRGVAPAVDLGAVRYLGDASQRTFVFAEGEAGVGSTCGETGETGEAAVGETGEGEIGETGVGEAAAGEVGDGQAGAGEMGVAEIAVAEHNLPDSLGCEGEVGPTGVDESEGQGVGSTSTGK